MVCKSAINQCSLSWDPSGGFVPSIRVFLETIDLAIPRRQDQPPAVHQVRDMMGDSAFSPEIPTASLEFQLRRAYAALDGAALALGYSRGLFEMVKKFPGLGGPAKFLDMAPGCAVMPKGHAPSPVPLDPPG
jgi:hypothetical protein